MKIKGSTGKVSRTIIFNSMMIVIDVLVANIQLFNEVLTPTQFAITFVVLGIAQKLGNVYLRTQTTKPLS